MRLGTHSLSLITSCWEKRFHRPYGFLHKFVGSRPDCGLTQTEATLLVARAALKLTYLPGAGPPP